MVIKSSFFQLRQLSKLKSFLSFKDFEIIIHICISSRLDYCNGLYVGIDQASLTRLQMVQNAAAHLLMGARNQGHITPILASLHWLPIRFRIDFTILILVFKALNGLAPTYLSDLIQPYAPSRGLRSTDHSLLVVPHVRLKSRGDRCNICRQEFNWLYQSPEGGRLRNQQPSKAPPPLQRKNARFLSITEQRNVTGTFLKDIRSFHDFQNIHTRNI